MVATSLPAWHMGWLQGHVLRSWSSSTHRASWEQGTACDRLQVCVPRSHKKPYCSLSRGWSEPTVTLDGGRLEGVRGPRSESQL